MAESPNPKRQIEAVYRPSKFFKVEPFDQSAVDYTKFVTQITRVLESLELGAVIAIDAPWGSGKTYFAQNMKECLNGRGWKTAFIDAFESDYLEDPFLLLASAIQTLASDAATKRGFIRAAGNVGKALLPVTAKAIVKVATAGALDLGEAEKAIADAAGSAAETLVEGKIKEFDKERESFATFRSRLSKLASKTQSDTGKPLVIFIDELDRCRPDFAVKTLERIKHLFDVQGVTFVLLLHAQQLQCAVEGVYGSINAAAYLHKFIHFTLPLPRTQNRPGQRPEVVAYTHYLARKVQVGEMQEQFKRAVQLIEYLAVALDMSLRDVERAILEFILNDVSPRMYALLIDTLTYIICIKITARPLYESILRRDHASITEHSALLERAIQQGLPDSYRDIFCGIVESHVTGKPTPQAVKRWGEMQMFHGPAIEDVFRILEIGD